MNNGRNGTTRDDTRDRTEGKWLLALFDPSLLLSGLASGHGEKGHAVN
jgi:hypothetical protein